MHVSPSDKASYRQKNMSLLVHHRQRTRAVLGTASDSVELNANTRSAVSADSLAVTQFKVTNRGGRSMEEPIRGCSDLKHFALQNAMCAFYKNRERPYGVAYWKAAKCLVMFCNGLAKLSAKQRDDQLTILRHLSKACGASELRYAEYPVRGRFEGSTYAILFHATVPQALHLCKGFEKLMQGVT